MAKIEKITELQWYDGSNKITDGLHWVQPKTNLGRARPMLMLDKENNIVGSYSGSMPILFDASYANKWQGKEIYAVYKDESYIKFVSQEQMLLHFCGALLQFAKMEPSEREHAKVVCLHAQTKFNSLADSCCSECGESISPSLVMGSLLMAAAELNEHIWEHGGKKAEKEAKVEVKEDE